MENSMAIPQKIKAGTAMWFSNLTSGYFSTLKKKSLIGKDICTSMLTEALFMIAKMRKQHESPSVDEQINKI